MRLSTQVDKPGLNVLRKLFARSSVSDRELEELQEEAGSYWAVFLLRERLGEQSYPREYMRSSLNAISPTGIYAVIHQESLTGLLRCSSESQEQQALFRQFSELSSRMGYQCGISNPFYQLRQIYTYLPQAAFAAAKAQEQGKELCQFESCTLDYLLESCLGDMTLEAMLGPGLRKLQHHDEAKGTQYIKTLNVYSLRKHYPTAHIQKYNRAAGGSTTQWGVLHAKELVCPCQPDLVILAFGMNSMQETAEIYQEKMASIIKTVRKSSPDCAFLLVSPMIPNPEIAGFQNNQLWNHEQALRDIYREDPNTDIAPVHSVFCQLQCMGKQYLELTGNCINHPNDFSVRIYAQTVLSVLLPEVTDI